MYASLKTPEIRIQYGWHLDEVLRRRAGEVKQANYSRYPSENLIGRKVTSFQRVWRTQGASILRAIVETLNLSFYVPVVDVYIVGRIQSFSNPLVISSHLRPVEFLDVLTHELLHRVLTDNDRHLDVEKIWLTMFPNEERLTRNHVLVHAVHELIYRKYLRSMRRLERDVELCSAATAYRRSWEIVRSTGGDKIIERFKTFYKK